MSGATVRIGELRLRLPGRDPAEVRALARAVAEQLGGLVPAGASNALRSVALRVEARPEEPAGELARRIARAIAAQIPATRRRGGHRP